MARADLYAGTPAAAPPAFTRITPRLFQSVDVDARTAGSFRASDGSAWSLASASASFPCWISALISLSAAACGEPDTLTGIINGVPPCRTIGWAAGSDRVTERSALGLGGDAGVSTGGGGVWCDARCLLLHHWQTSNNRNPRGEQTGSGGSLEPPLRCAALGRPALDSAPVPTGGGCA